MMQSFELFVLLFISMFYQHNTIVAIEILSNMNIETKSFGGLGLEITDVEPLFYGLQFKFILN